MRNKWKVLVICLLMAAVVLLEPVSYVRADDTLTESTEEGYDRTIGIPRLNSSEVKFEKKYFWDWFGLKNIPEENCIEELVLIHLNLENVDYSLYDLVCDFELKTMGTGEEVLTSTYSYNIDFSHYIIGWTLGNVDLLGDIVVTNHVDFGYDTFNHFFNYRNIVSNAEGFQERDITGKGKYYTYNTVISQADFYFVRKSDGEKGEARRFTFTWDSDFWMQKCTKIDFSWYDHETEIEKEIDFVEDLNGVDGYGDEVSFDEEILNTIMNIPLVVGRFLTGLLNFLGGNFSILLHCVFPFFPPTLCSIIVGFLVAIFVIRIASYFIYKR